MSCFTRVLSKSTEYKKIISAVSCGRLPMGVLGLSNVHKAHYISSICEDMEKKALIICPDEGQATRLTADLNTFAGGAYLYPARDFNFHTAESQSREFEQKRLGTLMKIITGDYRFVVCSVQAAMQFTMPADVLRKKAIILRENEEIGLDRVIQALTDAGYARSEQVDGIGQYAVRGGIVDFFPSHSAQPIRIEFWGDEIDTMTCFDIESQRRTDVVSQVEIIPATEILFSSSVELKEKIEGFMAQVKGKGSVNIRKHLQDDIDRLENGIPLGTCDKYYSLAYDKPETIFDYMFEDLLFVSESFSCKNKVNDYNKRFNEDIKLFLEDGTLAKGLDRYNIDFGDILRYYEDMGAVYTDNLSRGSFDTPTRELVSIRAQQNAVWDGTLSTLTEDLAPAVKKGYTCVVLAGTEKAAKELCYDLESADFKALYFALPPAEFPQNTVSVLPGGISAGIEYTDIKFLLVSFGKSFTAVSKKRKKAAIKQGKSIHSLEELHKGDYIVHATHGIGIFDGIHKMEISGVTKDYIKIQYAKQDVLMIPVTQLDMVAKYITPNGNENAKVKINRLGTNDWQKTRSKVKGAVKDMAAELTRLYSIRMNSEGFAFSPDIDMQSDFERRFEFDETDDQLVAINEIKKDMEKPCPMDRLLCGDVGFGKTEVALRAVFKCIADGKQCAILVPTTILAFQHYQTILKRFDGFPVEIEMLSRFRTQGEREKIKKALKRGAIDIVVGTHSIIAKSVEFKDLGLLIVDEEQRFGVAQKEKLKEKFPTVDVLTLSATPIPRTLNMAMSGIRDMSILEDPPQDRHPVQTYVVEHDMGIISQAIEREIRRGGQVYYLHNRVDGIEKTALKIKELVPDARVGVGHGKMSEDELSEVWRQLLEGEIDVLVCTTIIETGVDVPNANTLIIEEADKLGLAQLHQIRGRVGRSSRRAFAYLTFRPDKELTEVAQRRLNAIREYTQFGSGFQIAMRDLEIRGAGNVLGAQQHGHLAAVGYDMYLQLLSMAVEEEKGNITPEVKAKEKDCLIDLQIDAFIPETYIDAVKNRLYMYKRIADIRSEADASDVIDELCDRFGEPPKAVLGLIDVCLLRNSLSELNIYEVNQRNGALLMYSNDIDMKKVGRMSLVLKGRVMVSASARPYVSLKIAPGQAPIDALKQAIKIMKI
ncbi:MAG: transcription-repair coupling factor [Ruminococcaceae bacterium]|nr:transcription-repair coupling factor [Oscillospiraceae bacterium]